MILNHPPFKEFKNINLGDKRLNSRLIKLADDFSKHPDFSINQASKDWHAAKAAYRFFQNDKISVKNILQPHFKNTAERCKKQKFVLLIQDTCVIGLSHHPKTKGLGTIGGHPKPLDSVHGIGICQDRCRLSFYAAFIFSTFFLALLGFNSTTSTTDKFLVLLDHLRGFFNFASV